MHALNQYSNLNVRKTGFKLYVVIDIQWCFITSLLYLRMYRWIVHVHLLLGNESEISDQALSGKNVIFEIAFPYANNVGEQSVVFAWFV